MNGSGSFGGGRGSFDGGRGSFDGGRGSFDGGDRFSELKQLYDEACKRLKKCQNDYQLSQHQNRHLENINKSATMDQTLLRNELDSCLRMKSEMDKFIVLSSYQCRRLRVSLPPSRFPAASLASEEAQKRELDKLKEKLFIQNLKFQQYETRDLKEEDDWLARPVVVPPWSLSPSPLSSSTPLLPSSSSTPLFLPPSPQSSSSPNQSSSSNHREIRELEQKFQQTISSNLEKFQDELRERDAELEKVCDRVNERDVQITQLNEEIHFKDHTLKIMTDDISRKVQKIDELTYELKNSHRTADESSNQLTNSLSQLTDEKLGWEATARIHDQKFVEYDSYLSKSNTVIHEKNLELELVNKTKLFLNDQVLKLKSQLETETKLNQDYQSTQKSKLSELQQSNEKYSSELRRLEKVSQSQNQTVELLQRENQTLKEEAEIPQLKSSQDFNSTLNLTHEHLKEKLNRVNEDFLEEKASSGKLIVSLNLKIQTLENLKNLANVELSQLKNENQRLEKNLVSLDNDLGDYVKLKEGLNLFFTECSFCTNTSADFLINLNDVRDNAKDLTDKYENLVQDHNSTVQKNIQLTSLNETLQKHNQQLMATDNDFRQRNETLATNLTVLQEAMEGKPHSQQITKTSNLFKNRISEKLQTISKCIKTNLRLQNRITCLEVENKTLTLKNKKLDRHIDQISKKHRDVANRERGVLKMKQKYLTDYDLLRDGYNWLNEKSASAAVGNTTLLDSEHLHSYYEAFLSNLQDHLKKQSENVKQLLDDVFRLDNHQRNDIIQRNVVDALTPESVHSYYNSYLKYFGTNVESSSVYTQKLMNDFRNYKHDFQGSSPEERNLFDSIQKSQETRELIKLRSTKKTHETLMHFLNYLFTDELGELLNSLAAAKLLFEKQGLGDLINFMKSENIDSHGLKGYYLTTKHLVSFFKNEVGFLFVSEDVTSLIRIIKDFGGYKFIEGLKDIVVLRELYPQYDSLLNILSDLTKDYSTKNILHFFAVLQLVSDIHQLDPEEKSSDELAKKFVEQYAEKSHHLDLVRHDRKKQRRSD